MKISASKKMALRMIFLLLIIILFISIVRYIVLMIEVKDVELPEIVFMYSASNPEGEGVTKIIDREGNIYDNHSRKSVKELVQIYQDGKMEAELDKVGKVNVVKLKKKHSIFMELVDNSEYRPEFDPAESLPDIEQARMRWTGFYYDYDNNFCTFRYYEKISAGNSVCSTIVPDKRGVQLANWIEKKVTDSWFDKLFTL